MVVLGCGCQKLKIGASSLEGKYLNPCTIFPAPGFLSSFFLKSSPPGTGDGMVLKALVLCSAYLSLIPGIPLPPIPQGMT